MRVWTGVLCLGLSATSGCASSSGLLELHSAEGKPPAAGRERPLPELGIAERGISTDRAPAAVPKHEHASLERQLHLIAESQLDVMRDDAEGLFEEIRAQRLLAQAAIDDAANELRRRREADNEDPTTALRRLREVATVSQDARGTVVVLPCLRWFSDQSAELSPAAKAELDEIARALTELDPSAPISIEARPETRGGSDTKLSERRALSVRGHLIGWGIGKARLSAWGREVRAGAASTKGGELEIVLGNTHPKGQSAASGDR